MKFADAFEQRVSQSIEASIAVKERLLGSTENK